MPDLATQPLPWNFGSKIAFRFIFIYFILYIFPFPLDSILQYLPIGFDPSMIWDAMVVWTGKIFFDLEITQRPNGSGDTTWNYVIVFMFGLLALIGCIIWSAFDRKRTNYDRLYFWLTVLVRYYLGATMVSYGMYKVIKTQFPFPGFGRLEGTYGDSSPMGLLWTFMGYSTAYNVFTGLSEVLGGLLLFFRKTRMLGALLCVAVMGNVVMLNFSYDVPVKLFSSHLLLMSFFLLLPDVKRLLNFFLLNRQVPVETITPYFNPGKWRISYYAGKSVFIAFVVLPLTYFVWDGYGQWGDGAPKPPMYGSYHVESFVINSDTIPKEKRDTRAWKRISVSYPGRVGIRYSDDADIWYTFEADTTARTFKIKQGDSTVLYTFAYEKIEGKKFMMKGSSEKDSIHLLVTRKGPEDFLLVNRGFHWINETPFNR